MCFRWSENSVRFENLMGISFQKNQILWDFISQCEVWHVCINQNLQYIQRRLCTGTRASVWESHPDLSFSVVLSSSQRNLEVSADSSCHAPYRCCCYCGHHLVASKTNRFHSNSDQWYGKCSKTLNSFLFLFSNKMLAFRARFYKMLVRIANREDPDQTASLEAVWSGSALFV